MGLRLYAALVFVPPSVIVTENSLMDPDQSQFNWSSVHSLSFGGNQRLRMAWREGGRCLVETSASL